MRETVLCAIGVAALLAPAFATAAEDPGSWPTLASGEGEGDGWVALRIRTDGAPYGIFGAATSRTDQAMGGEGILFLDLAGRAFDRHVVIGGQPAWDPLDPGSFVEADIRLAGVAVSAGREADTLGGHGIGSYYPDRVPPHEAYIVLWMAGDVDRRNWSFRGWPGVEVLAVETGSSAYWLGPRDFGGTVNVRVVGDGAEVFGLARLDVGGTLVGGFWGRGTDVESTMRHPDGWTQECACASYDVHPDGWGPGAYELRTTGAGGRLGSPAFTGADVRLPAQA